MLKNAAFIFILGLVCSAADACEVYFNIVGDPDSYEYRRLPEFIRNEMRPRVKGSSNQDRYGLQIQSLCSSASEEKPLIATFKVQPNNVYLKEINELPLCVEDATGRCLKNSYDYVAYDGGAKLKINEEEALKQLQVLSEIDSLDDLGTTDQAKQENIHNAVRFFAMLLAESTRFDYVLDDLTCATASGSALQFDDYWKLVHNWGSISKAVKLKRNEAEKLKAPATYQGAGDLFVPITRSMVPFFNGFLPSVANDPDWKPSDDGRNLVVPERTPSCTLAWSSPGNEQEERDEIFSLLAMAVVLQDWQVNKEDRRGHNIGGVLVDTAQKPIFYARNSVRKLNDTTQHGEVRLIQNYLKCGKGKRNAASLTVYTTLEPCAMCTGMMTMAEVKRVVYVQQDPGFGKAREALQRINYPRIYTQDTVLGLPQKTAIERGYEQYLSSGKKSLTDYLLTDEAHQVFESALASLKAYTVKYPGNAAVLNDARSYLNTVETETVGEAVQARCPASST
ncbi:nucleoside deaminase [Pseudomonas corrugata]|uniref:Nucleoside deaminase n=1 Tax=Pseudomonas corrugata TaxID=47879 RepID=A0A8B6UXC3_9PSED|nr:nucleoside deaminase [Pseudomonas corrugata]AOE65174.1 hypothetical protein AXG94_26515 [Pseudomonas corrugata]MDU9040539.1 nucleoside deaminase [Pseudomonas corrugata]QTH16550.1 nucleoside deaminase [Pseudomonas corrugata]